MPQRSSGRESKSRGSSFPIHAIRSAALYRSSRGSPRSTCSRIAARKAARTSRRKMPAHWRSRSPSSFARRNAHTMLMLRESAVAIEAERADRSLTSRYAGRTVLAIGAHPDDLEIGIGGTLARLSRAGARVVMVIASIPSNYEIRLAEAKSGARILGADLRVLLNGGRCCRVEDLKTYELVNLFDGL